MSAYEKELMEYLDGMEHLAEYAVNSGRETVAKLWKEVEEDAASRLRGVSSIEADLRRIETEKHTIDIWETRLFVIQDVKRIMNKGV